MKKSELGTLAGVIAGESGAAATSLIPAPSALLISPSSVNGGIILNWTASVPPPTTYEVWRSTDGGVTFTHLASVAGGVTTYTDLSVMSASDQWYYEIRGIAGPGFSLFTDPAGIFNGFSQAVNTGVTTYSFPFLQMVIGAFLVNNQLALTSISTPTLHTVTGVWDIQSNTLLATVSVPLLVTVGSQLNATLTPSLTSLSFPSLTSVGLVDNSGVEVVASGITSFSAPVLTATGIANFSVRHCTSMTSIVVSSIIFINGTTISCESCALDATSVNGILARGVASGTTTSSYNLAFGTNAAPTGQGILDKATLIGAGNSVTTN